MKIGPIKKMNALLTQKMSVAMFIVSAILGLASLPAAAQIDNARSSITATAKQLGVPIEGRFKKMTATVLFMPSRLAQSSAKIDIEVGSYDMGAAEYNKEVLGKEWFNAAQYPKATFASTTIAAAGADRYMVSGKLTLKNKVADVSFPIIVKSVGGVHTFDGVLPIKRSVFHVGEGEWKDVSVVADEVLIKFHLVTAGK